MLLSSKSHSEVTGARIEYNSVVPICVGDIQMECWREIEDAVAKGLPNDILRSICPRTIP